MKKVLYFCFIGIFLSMLSNCSPEHFLLKDFDFAGVEWINPNETKDENKKFVVKDTLNDRLHFRLFAYGEYEYGFLNEVSLIQKSYATSVEKVLDNELLLNELKITLNSDIYFESEVIESGINLWNHPKLEDYKWFYRTKSTGAEYNAIIGFTDALYDKIEIPKKDYVIEITVKTTDGQVMSKSQKIYLNI